MTTLRSRPRAGLRERKKQALHARLIEIAGRRFREAGYAGTQMREIAEEAGVAYQTLYNYYPNKARLGIAWLRSVTEAINARTSSELETIPDDPLEYLLAHADRWVDVIAGTDREIWRELNAEYMRSPDDFDDTTRVLYAGTRDQLESLLEAWRAAGVLRAGTDCRTLAGVLFALTDYAMLRFVGVEALPTRELLDELHAQLSMVIEPALAPRRARES